MIVQFYNYIFNSCLSCLFIRSNVEIFFKIRYLCAYAYLNIFDFTLNSIFVQGLILILGLQFFSILGQEGPWTDDHCLESIGLLAKCYGIEKVFFVPFYFHIYLYSNFKDKNYDDIFELLQVLYPPNKPINALNIEKLLELADEYQMIELNKRCRTFLMQQRGIW